jgi:hypothetical protein
VGGVLPVKAHICIGGPLDGEYATSADFHGGYEKVPGTNRNDYSKKVEGMYEHLSDQYWQYNNSYNTRKRAPVLWMHESLLTRMPISPRER